ncbi:MAG: hypothetical protein K9K66_18395 [Desulfarculaceae bacterium]|nr:hypothetical protein [Desulfarculaceae bacterium]MCF8074394.1 hypothetical protein [Desulfarculaceae bacterium]MCF8103630.1 hypothetical protein [Desulfarculaceae bacterium]MCF8116043.1 hypothetical protein [Desulfarculaceae bacterium]
MKPNALAGGCWSGGRIFLLLALLLNLAIYVSFANFFPLERGIARHGKIAAALSGESGKDVQRLADKSKTGKFSFLYVEPFNNAHGDGTQYMLQALGHQSYPPFSLRPLLPRAIGLLVNAVSWFIDGGHNIGTKINLFQPVMSLLNSLVLALSVWLLFLAARKFLADELLCLAIALFVMINVGAVQTAQFFMLDVFSYGIGALIIWLFVGRRYLLMVAAICLGVLGKEILIAYLGLLLLPVLTGRKGRLNYLLLGLAPVAVFVGLRVFAGEDPLSMQYGWKVSQGGLSLKYLAMHFGSLGGFLKFAIKLLFALGLPLILALFAWKDSDKALVATLSLVVALVVAADVILASRVCRIVFAAYPALAILAALGVKNLLNPAGQPASQTT